MVRSTRRVAFSVSVSLSIYLYLSRWREDDGERNKRRNECMRHQLPFLEEEKHPRTFREPSERGWLTPIATNPVEARTLLCCELGASESVNIYTAVGRGLCVSRGIGGGVVQAICNFRAQLSVGNLSVFSSQIFRRGQHRSKTAMDNQSSDHFPPPKVSRNTEPTTTHFLLCSQAQITGAYAPPKDSSRLVHIIPGDGTPIDVCHVLCSKRKKYGPVWGFFALRCSIGNRRKPIRTIKSISYKNKHQ